MNISRLPPAGIALWLGLALWLAACGGGTGDRHSTSSDAPAVARSSQKLQIGDYDADEYEQHASDSDNDDMSAKRVRDYDADEYEKLASDSDNDDMSAKRDRDNDFDNKTGSYFDPDDAEIRGLGHAANRRQTAAVRMLVTRYISIAAAENGAAGCQMLASFLRDTIVETLGKPPGAPYYRGNTCTEVLTKVFKQNHSQLAAYVPTLRVSGVRVEHAPHRPVTGVAILAFKNIPGRQLRVVEQDGAWKLDGLLDLELP